MVDVEMVQEWNRVGMNWDDCDDEGVEERLAGHWAGRKEGRVGVSL